MDLHVVTTGNRTFLEGTPGTQLLRTAEDAVDIIGTCFEHEVRSILLYAENLTEGFFDLSTGEAGAILQKFRNYHIKVAVVIPQDRLQRSSKYFQDMAREESRGNDFRVFDDRASAEVWLIGD